MTLEWAGLGAGHHQHGHESFFFILNRLSPSPYNPFPSPFGFLTPLTITTYIISVTLFLYIVGS